MIEEFFKCSDLLLSIPVLSVSTNAYISLIIDDEQN